MHRMFVGPNHIIHILQPTVTMLLLQRTNQAQKSLVKAFTYSVLLRMVCYSMRFINSTQPAQLKKTLAIQN